MLSFLWRQGMEDSIDQADPVSLPGNLGSVGCCQGLPTLSMRTNIFIHHVLHLTGFSQQQ